MRNPEGKIRVMRTKSKEYYIYWNQSDKGTRVRAGSFHGALRELLGPGDYREVAKISESKRQFRNYALIINDSPTYIVTQL